MEVNAVQKSINTAAMQVFTAVINNLRIEAKELHRMGHRLRAQRIEKYATALEDTLNALAGR